MKGRRDEEDAVEDESFGSLILSKLGGCGRLGSRLKSSL